MNVQNNCLGKLITCMEEVLQYYSVKPDNCAANICGGGCADSGQSDSVCYAEDCCVLPADFRIVIVINNSYNNNILLLS